MKNHVDDDLNHKLHRLLGAIFIPTLSIEEKKDILIKEFDFNIAKKRKELLEGFLKAISKMLESGMPKEEITKMLQATPEQIEETENRII